MRKLAYCTTDFNGHVYTIVHVRGGGMHAAVLIQCGGCGFCCLLKGPAQAQGFCLVSHNLFLIECSY